jgi:hypothetical protein
VPTLIALSLLLLSPAHSSAQDSSTGGVASVDYDCEGNVQGDAVQGTLGAETELVYQFAAGGGSFARGASHFAAPLSDTLLPLVGGLAEVVLPTGQVEGDLCRMNAGLTFEQGYVFAGSFTDTLQAKLDYEIDWLVQVPSSSAGSAVLEYEFFQGEDSFGKGAFDVNPEGVFPSGLAADQGIVITPLGRGMHSVQGGGVVTVTVSIVESVGVDAFTSVFLPGGSSSPITVTSQYSRGLSFDLVSLNPDVTITPDTIVPPEPSVDCDTSDEIAQQIDACAEDAPDHGQFVSCVANLANQLKKDGVISGKEKGRITSCVAQADVP